MANIMCKIDRAVEIADRVTDRAGIAPAMTSISSQAAKSTYYFPVIVSQSVSGKAAQLLSANLETHYAYFMRACFALNPAIRVKGDVNIEEYLKRFHQNVGIDKNKFGIVLKEETEEFMILPNDPLNERYSINEAADDKDKDKDKEDKRTPLEKSYDEFVKGVRDIKTAVGPGQSDVKAITENEIKKVNGLSPTIIPATITFLTGDGGSTKVTVNIPVGIKTQIHTADSLDLCNRLIDTLAGHSTLGNFIRWTTGEVESLGDMLFGTKNMKKNISGEKMLDKWFDVIERRKRINKLSLGLAAKRPFLPNMSMVISIDDVNDIERKTKINFLKGTRFAKKLIQDCFLLTFVVVDDAAETAYILYDGHNDFEEIPFNAIKRDTDKSNSAIDSLVKVLAMK